ncbi:MAG: hypothetical protein IJP30_02560 [Clostridia bacterium]|nr:hypothetical protein [Clostridia bacterium]
MAKTAAIIGAGKIGRGYLAYSLEQSGYTDLVYINNRTNIIDIMNQQGYYTRYITWHETGELTSSRIPVKEAYASSRDMDKICQRLSEIDLITIALYPTAYPSVADQLAGAIKLRIANKVDRPVNLLFFVNKVMTGRIMRRLLDERLPGAEEQAYLNEKVGFVEALTYGGGINPTPEMLAEDPAAVYAGIHADCKLRVGDNFLGERPGGLFEYQDRMEGRLVKKVWCGNVRHCTQAVVGQFMGCKYIYEATRLNYVRMMCDYVGEEANFAVAKEFGFTREEMDYNTPESWRNSMKNETPDDVGRVAADAFRKLSRDDRFIGPALLCLKYGVLPYYLARGAAYLLYFKNDNDPTYVEMHRIIGEIGIEKAIEQFCQLDLSVRDEKLLYDMILAHYREIGKIELNPVD